MKQNWFVTYVGIRVATYDDVDWTWAAVAQDSVDVIQCHAVDHIVVDLHNLISTPGQVVERTTLHHGKYKTSIQSSTCVTTLIRVVPIPSTMWIVLQVQIHTVCNELEGRGYIGLLLLMQSQYISRKAKC